MKRPGSRACALVFALAVCFVLPGCAYFNTYYSAKKNFDAAERLYLNPDDRANAQQAALYDKAIQSAAKLVANYPKSKWVDDAVYLTGRSLFAKGEDEKARQTFTELADKFPQSPYVDEALYYQAETFRREHKWDTAVVFYDSLRRTFPKSKMLDETTMREAQVELASFRPRNAVAMLLSLDTRKLSDRSLYEWHHALADAYFAVPAYDSAYVEYEWIAEKARTPDAYHDSQMRLGDCLEGARHFDIAAEHYHDYERDARTPEYRDQASIRRASAMASAGHVNEGLLLLRDIVNDKTRTNVAPQALYQIGFIQETTGEDSKAARATYAKVTEQYKTSPYSGQAQARLTNLDKMDALRAAAASDTTGREAAAAAAFAVAERYLVDSDRPERAVQEYAKVEQDYANTQVAPKASFAAGWVFYRKLQHKEAADSVWKHVLAAYPQTLYGQAASALLRGREDSLRVVGAFSKTLIKVPYSPGALLYVPPETRLTTQKTAVAMTRADSIRVAHEARAAASAPRDTTRKALPDTTRKAPPDTTHVARPDTTRTQAKPDTTVHKAPSSGAAGPVPPAQGGR
ncbi:MAG TPA: tetratricopeptide repeat protein [Candidatus Eisenbacteria bacterium]|nr:tetratricopeptide repeat protein [Candidatus Eisenbacteria bacterium]